ncbi:TnsA endonuclease N-terminal domain-containing protein [Herbaspirillum rubrisubalbicans]|uniref:TnsA endonuclease N-terminal domain-containing protein n=1 Tax=Herbaspirillum rubrisubalbicans TaxID=80842 RepID=UPI000DD33078|nr:TnsA endonuclease N-terminal domain-containing protein [Herbaspirillum rubrisubalbicans]
MSNEKSDCITSNFLKRRANPRDPIRIQQRALEQARGLGVGSDYEPFIQIERHGFSSHGRSHVWSDPLNTSIIGHVLSDLERCVLIHASSLKGAIVRTQYPMWRVGVEPEFAECVSDGESLDLGTVRVANELGVKPPRTRGQDIVLTLDLLLKIPGKGTWAVYVKYCKDVPRPGSRQDQLLQITREYWRLRNVDLLIITEVEAKDSATMRWLNWASSIRGSYAPGSDEFLLSVVDLLILKTDSHVPMNERIACLDVPADRVIHALKYAIWVGYIWVDFQRWDWPCLADPWTIELASRPRKLASANCFSFIVAGGES